MRLAALRRPLGGGLPLYLAAAAYVLALWQRPGQLAADTKIDLHVDAGQFLGEVASVWSSSGGLGQVQAGQYAGYLFPMGPFFALGDLLGLAPWLVHRLWLGTLLAVAAWGVVRLLDALLERPRGVAHLVAGAMVLLNPYVVVFANRTSVTLLGYAALPWLLLAVHRGVRDRGGWRWPAAFALVLAATGGGVNAAVTGWILAGPLLLLAYEATVGGVGWAGARSFALRAAPAAVLASLWWLVPVAAHARYGLNFLPFTESVGGIWATTGITESLRLMGYWISYLGVGFGARPLPYFDTSPQLLFSAPVLIASLLVPALALGGFAWTRRWRYGPFFLALALLGALVMVAGFPEGGPLRRALTFGYHHLEPLQFLRTTYKAGPLVALGLACLGGAAAAEGWRRLGSPRLRMGVATAAAVLLAVAAWPLVRGRAVDEQIAFDRVPDAWTDAAGDLDRELPRGSRAVVLPGQILPFYSWGGTQDPILPALAERPVAVRTLVPYSDLHAADLLFTTDALVQQRRALPGQLDPLLRLMGVRAVVTGSDDDLDRSGAVDPASAAEALGTGADRRYGRMRRVRPRPGELGSAVALPQVRRRDPGPGRGLVGLEPVAPMTVVDGSAEGLAGLAAFGALPGAGALHYAGDRSVAELRRAAAAGAELVVSDSNRRRVFVSSRSRQNLGATLGPDDPVAPEAAFLDPFEHDSVAQTVADYDGAKHVRAPFSPGYPQFPEHRPYAAFDGSTETAWVADRHLDRSQSWVEVAFERPRPVPYVDVVPARETETEVTSVEVAGRRHRIRPGRNRLPVRLRSAGKLRVQIAGTRDRPGREQGRGALAEVAVPGLRVRERLRPPRLVERALAGRDLRRAGLTYVLARTTGDDPFRRPGRLDLNRGAVRRDRDRESVLSAEPGDAEAGFARQIAPPAPREFDLDAWVSPAPDLSDPDIDRLVGFAGAQRLGSSSRLDGLPAHRASRAFDGDLATSWIGDGAERAPWISWRTSRPVELRTFAIEPPVQPVGAPTAVRVRWRGGRTEPLPVSPVGEVDLPRPVRAREFALEVVEALRPPLAPGRAPQATGIGELRVPGVRPVRMRRSGRLEPGCAVRVRAGKRVVRLRPAGDVRDLDAGRPLRARGCGRPLRLPAGESTIEVAGRPWRVSLVRLRSPAPEGLPAPRGGGRVVDPGEEAGGERDEVRLALAGPAWLVLGESFNEGWRAWCDGRSLGEPRVVNGYANGWRVAGRCKTARFAFSPGGWARPAYALSALTGLVLLVLLVLSRRRPAPFGAPTPLPESDPPARWPWRRSLVAGLLAGLGGAFLFAVSAGPVIGVVVALVLRRGIGAGRLSLAAGGLLALVVPALYLLFIPEDRGGFNATYASDLLAAHWVALGAGVLLALALVRTLSRASLRSDGRAGEQRAEGGPPAPP